MTQLILIINEKQKDKPINVHKSSTVIAEVESYIYFKITQGHEDNEEKLQRAIVIFCRDAYE